ncbi:MAG: MJ0042-type zinc finger domain-containing protein [Pseudomonadota bacterium]
MARPPNNLLNARLAQGVARVGFRKWYERELLSSHAHMVLALLSLVAALASFEVMASADGKALNLVLAAGSAIIGVWAIRRYLFLLMRAEYVANQATCAECKAYGRFEVVAEDQATAQTEVRCRRCEHRWVISED